jgi:aminoglycoside 2'-N-acetyltransferase I
VYEDDGMPSIRTAHTADLDPATLDTARSLLFDVFAGDFAHEDWEHGLGGVHAVANEGAVLVGHASVVMRRLVHQGRALRCGYVEAVGVHPDHQRRGIGTALMTALKPYVAGGYDVGALGASDQARPMYASLGWQPWRGRLSALTPDGLRPTPDEQGAVYVLPGAASLDLDGELACDWRDGDVW